jgi:hypothetical protein
MSATRSTCDQSYRFIIIIRKEENKCRPRLTYTRMRTEFFSRGLLLFAPNTSLLMFFSLPVPYFHIQRHTTQRRMENVYLSSINRNVEISSRKFETPISPTVVPIHNPPVDPSLRCAVKLQLH